MTFEVIIPVTASRLKLVENATGIVISPDAPWEGGCCFILCDDESEVKGFAQGHRPTGSGLKGKKNTVVCHSHRGYFHLMAVYRFPSMTWESPIRPFLLFIIFQVMYT